MALSIAEIPVDQILTDETAREPGPQLIASLRKNQLLVPIKLRERGDGTYELTEGRRRLAGARKLGWATITAIVVPENEATLPNDKEAILINTERKNLEQLHIARHVRRLMKEGDQTQAELARDIHCSQAAISLMLKVMECADLLAAIEREGLEFGAARAIAKLPPAVRAELLAELRQVREQTGKLPSVRQVEERVHERQGKPALGALTAATVPTLLAELELRDLPVQITVGRARRTGLRLHLAVAPEDEAWIAEILASTGPGGNA